MKNITIINGELPKHSNQSFSLHQWNTELSNALLPNSIILGLYCLIGVLGNTPVIIVYLFRMRGNLGDRFFIPFLASFDLLTTVFMTADHLTLDSFPVLYMNNALCKTLNFLNRIFAASSDCLLLVIAVHRYMKICRPFHSQMNSKEMQRVVLFVFIFSTIVNIPVIVFRGVHKVVDIDTNLEGYKCDHIHDNHVIETCMYIYDAAVLIFLLFEIVILAILYTFVAKSIRNTVRLKKLERKNVFDMETKESFIEYKGKYLTEKSVNENTDSDQKLEYKLHKTQQNECDRKITVPVQRRYTLPVLKIYLTTNRYTYMFMVLTFLFVISYTPSNILKIIEIRWPGICSDLMDSKCRVYLFFSQFHIFNHIVNPFIYSMFDKTFRTQFKEMIWRQK